jgi:uncharacterized NAD(P)/FAD-binding protein YdhS
MQNIIIIGGGAAGVSTIAQLVDNLISNGIKDVLIYLIEKNKTIGPGLPYTTQIKNHILNLNASIMSPLPDQPDAFAKWLMQFPEKWPSDHFKDKITNDLFPPRYIYGLYLKDLASEIVKKAHLHSIQIKIFCDVEAIDIYVSSKNKLLVTLSDNKKYLADQVILCTGHLPSAFYQKFKQHPGYFESPWNERCQNISFSEPVILIGSRLTAIDAALALANNSHIGKIHMVSRSGLLPVVLGPIKPYSRQVLTLEKLNELSLKGEKLLSLEEVLNLFWKELKITEVNLFDFKNLPDSSLTPEQWLIEEIKAAESGPREWQSVFMSVYTIIPEIWQLLNEKDKAIFLEYFYGLFMTYLVAFPIENAKKILHLLQTGQLEIHAGLSSINYNNIDKCYHAVCSDQIIKSAYVINATGPGYDIIQSDSKLFKALLDRELIIPHVLGGIQLDFKTLKVKNIYGKTTLPLFAVGEITHGEYLATTDLGQTTKQIRQVVHQIIKLSQVPVNASPSKSSSHFFSKKFTSLNNTQQTYKESILPKSKL